MNDQVTIRRSRGAVSGVALILLGLWGGLAPFVGPYFPGAPAISAGRQV
jgi:hypothetical protein